MHASVGGFLPPALLAPDAISKLLMSQDEEWHVQRVVEPQEQEETQAIVEPPGAVVPECEPDTQNAKDVQARSRKLISSATTTPEWLLKLFPLGEDVTMVHIQHKSNVLPHFQARFVNGTKHAGKLLGGRDMMKEVLAIGNSIEVIMTCSPSSSMQAILDCVNLCPEVQLCRIVQPRSSKAGVVQQRSDYIRSNCPEKSHHGSGHADSMDLGRRCQEGGDKTPKNRLKLGGSKA